MSKQAIDWRERDDVKKARAAFDQAEAAVNRADAAVAQAAGAVRQGEMERQRVVDGIMVGKATAQALIAARGRLAEAKSTLEAAETAAEATYGPYAAAKQHYEALAQQARAESWPAALAAYVEAASVLDKALEQVVAAEGSVLALHRSLGEQFGSAGGWILGEGERIGNATFNRRPLTPEGLASWRAWRIEAGVVSAVDRAKHAASRMAEGLKKLAGREQAEAERQELAAKERAAARWASTRQLSPSGLVRVSMQGVGNDQPR